jgi:hypothetical protein
MPTHIVGALITVLLSTTTSTSASLGSRRRWPASRRSSSSSSRQARRSDYSAHSFSPGATPPAAATATAATPLDMAAPPPIAVLGQLNVRDFGAVGDGHADDAPSLQRAINAALASGQTLVVPAGRYRVNSTLGVMSSARAGYAKPGPGFAKHPLRLVGEGSAQTVIFAAPVPGGMHAVLNFSSANRAAYGPAAPIPTEGQYVGDIGISAAGHANYSIFAPGIARSRFVRVDASGAKNVGMSIGYGWCVYIEGCRFGDNGVGLHTYNSANNIDVIDSIFEGNAGVGIFASEGAQLLFSGNVLEGNGISAVGHSFVLSASSAHTALLQTRR